MVFSRYFLSFFSFRFLHDTRGYVLITTAFLAGILALLGGFAIDYSSTITQRDRLHAAVDGAALFLSNDIFEDEADAEDRALNHFNANFSFTSAEDDLDDFSVEIDEEKITVCAEYSRKSFFPNLFSFSRWDMDICSEVSRDFESLEVVMILDNTGSMNYPVKSGESTTKIDALKEASRDLVRILYESVERSTNTNFKGDSLLKIGLVPFAATINVGKENMDSFWVRNQPLRYAPAGEDGRRVDDLFRALETEWYGCVEARSGDYDVDDTPPSQGDEATLWSKYFYPDEPDFSTEFSNDSTKVCMGRDNEDHHSYYNNYLYDFSSDDLRCDDRDYASRLRLIEKYSYENRVSPLKGSDDSSKGFDDPGEKGPNHNCVEPIVALTDEKEKILSALDGMTANGFTIIPFGLSWGWRVLSPDEPYIEGKAYHDKVRKILILLTDGVNSIPQSDSHVYKSAYTAYGFVSENRFHSGSNAAAIDDVQITESLNDKTSILCDRIKAVSGEAGGEEIEIFTISFGLVADSEQTQNAKDLLERCASSKGNYFDAQDNDALRSAFEDIAAKLSKARISK